MAERNDILVVKGMKKYFPVQGSKDKFVRAIDGINFTLTRGRHWGW